MPLGKDNPVMMDVLGICHVCIHRRTLETCDAFPEGIPVEILTGDINHTVPYKGDHGIRFEKKQV